MKLILSYSHITSSPSVKLWIETSLASLQPHLRIEEAHVAIEHNRESSPPYRVSALLKVPGPDLHAEGNDYTLHTAFERVMRDLRDSAVDRAARRNKRRSGQRVLRAYQPAHALRM